DCRIHVGFWDCRWRRVMPIRPEGPSPIALKWGPPQSECRHVRVLCSEFWHVSGGPRIRMMAGLFRKSRSSDSGSVLVMTAIALPVLIAFAALSLDVGYIYDYRQRMSAAADAAATSAAF